MGKFFQHGSGGRDVLFAANAKHGAAPLAGEIAIREAGAGKDSLQLPGERFVRLTLVKRLTAGGHSGGDIFRPLHTPFDFKGEHAGFVEFPDASDQ